MVDTTDPASYGPVDNSTSTYLVRYDQDIAPFQLPWTRFTSGLVCAQLSGTATNAVVVILRSAIGPYPSGVAPDAAPADATPMGGNPAAGVAPNVYIEPAVAYWTALVTSVTGGYVGVSLSGAAG